MVLVCVTDQESCDRLIYAGHALAQHEGIDLKVICVRPKKAERWLASDEVEYLFNVAKELEAEMLVYFNDNAAQTVATYVNEGGVSYVLVGMPPEPGNSIFITTLEDQCPGVSVITVDRAGSLHLVPVTQEFPEA